jgi:hypothetical protein
VANSWQTIKDAGTWVAAESLYLLKSKLNVSRMFNTDYSKEFKLSYPVGNSISIPYPQQYGIRQGLEYNPPAASARFATISIGEPFGIDVPEIDSIEAAISSPRSKDEFSKRYLDPAMVRLAQEIDSRCALFAYQHAAGVVGALGTNPTTFDATSGAARQYLQEMGAPEDGERAMIVPPAVIRAIKASNIGLFNPVADISKMFRRGIIGMSDGFDWYESMSLYRHTAGMMATGGATVTTASVNGATTLVLTTTDSQTVKAGDKFSVASVLPVHPVTKRTFGTTAKSFTILTAATSASSTTTITFSPAMYGPTSPLQNVDALALANAALTFWPGTTSPSGKTGNVGLALPKDAFALVGLDLELHEDLAVSKTQRDPETGIGIRFEMGSDIRTSTRIRRFDTCIGFGELYSDLAVAVACA